MIDIPIGCQSDEYELCETPHDDRAPAGWLGVSGELRGGQVFGDYEIVSVAGAGGMGIVYRATQRSLGRTVALKVIREEIARTPEYRDRFLREARLAASVDNPHVVRVYDVGEEDGRLFLAMQWVDGEDLRQVLERSGRLAPERAVLIATQLAGALDAVHGVAGLVHRDVKPSNVLLGKVAGQDHAYLTDFGVAKPSDASDQLTRTGWVVGTAGYLAPEQIRGQEPGPASDMYALGCLFFEALTGQPPFGAENEMALRWAHANNPRPEASAMLPALGRRYDEFLAVALAIEPAQRFASGRQFAEALALAHSGNSPTAATAHMIVPPPHAQTAVGPPTPMPPVPLTPQPPPPMYPGYVYATPAPVQPQPSSGRPLTLILLALVAVVGIAAGALAASGALSHGSSTNTIPPAASPSALKGHAPTQQKHGAPPARTSSCGGDLSVGPDTSCPFAQNVEKAYDESSGGETDVSAYSPATGETYTMHCTSELPHICTGGKGAAVYFNSGPSSAAATPTSTTPPSTQAEGGNLPDESSGQMQASIQHLLYTWHEDVVNGNDNAAWGLLSERKRQQDTEKEGYATWAKNQSTLKPYLNPSGIKVSIMNTEPSAGEATVDVTGMTWDKPGASCSEWSGITWALYENGSWHYDPGYSTTPQREAEWKSRYSELLGGSC
jgi:serine/threonine protein kinase